MYQLALAREERTTDGLEFVTRCKNEYDRLIEQSPSIPSSILTDFEKDYPLDNIFTKPEILDVRAIPKLKLPGFTNLKPSSVIAETTKGGPFSKIDHSFTRTGILTKLVMRSQMWCAKTQ